MRPTIGITVDNQGNSASSGIYESAIRYSRLVADAGGLPVLIPHEVESAVDYVAVCDGLVLTGGGDPDPEPFGVPRHPKARLMDPRRQAFEMALLERVARARPQMPVLGVCLGMQLMALHAGGWLNQFLPDTLERAEVHESNRRHPLVFCAADSVLRPGPGEVISSHRQAVADPGSMRTVAVAPDGIIEAVDDPHRPFYVGVQWHPERGDDPDSWHLNDQLLKVLIDAAHPDRSRAATA